MTTDTYINENKTASFNKGDKVEMINCYEATFDKNKGKVWTCKTDSFLDKANQEVVFLEGFSGYFAVEFLKKVEGIMYYTPIIFQSIAKNDNWKYGGNASTTYSDDKEFSFKIGVNQYGITKKVAKEKLIKFLSSNGKMKIECVTKPLNK